MATKIDQTDWVSTALRMPRELRDALHSAVQESGRSLNAEIVARLQTSFADAPDHTELQQQLAHARDLAEAKERALKSMEGSAMLMTGLLRMCVEMLPPAKQKEPVARVALQLANAALHQDGVAMADAFADLFAGDETVVSEMQKLAKELLAEKKAQSKKTARR